MLNLLILFLVACLIVVPWLIANKDGFLGTVYFYSKEFAPNPQAAGSSFADHILFFRTLLGDMGLAIFMTSLLLTVRRPRSAFFLLTWVVFPVMFFSQLISLENLIGPIQLRYLAPVIPAVAIIEAYGLFQIMMTIKKKLPKSERWQALPPIVILCLVISWLHTLTDRLDETIAKLEDAAALRARPIVVQVYNNYESGQLGGIFYTKIKARSLVKSDSFRISLCYRPLLAEKSTWEGTEGKCLQNLHEAEVIVLAVKDGISVEEWSHDAAERLEGILHNESDYELYYVMPRSITTTGWASLRESGDPIDWIAGEHWSMEDWQKDITLESVEEFAGVIYVRKGIV